jgi:hypothetical protein
MMVFERRARQSPPFLFLFIEYFATKVPLGFLIILFAACGREKNYKHWGAGCARTPMFIKLFMLQCIEAAPQ